MAVRDPAGSVIRFPLLSVIRLHCPPKVMVSPAATRFQLLAAMVNAGPVLAVQKGWLEWVVSVIEVSEPIPACLTSIENVSVLVALATPRSWATVANVAVAPCVCAPSYPTAAGPGVFKLIVAPSWLWLAFQVTCVGERTVWVPGVPIVVDIWSAAVTITGDEKVTTITLPHSPVASGMTVIVVVMGGSWPGRVFPIWWRDWRRFFPRFIYCGPFFEGCVWFGLGVRAVSSAARQAVASGMDHVLAAGCTNVPMMHDMSVVPTIVSTMLVVFGFGGKLMLGQAGSRIEDGVRTYPCAAKLATLVKSISWYWPHVKCTQQGVVGVSHGGKSSAVP